MIALKVVDSTLGLIKAIVRKVKIILLIIKSFRNMVSITFLSLAFSDISFSLLGIVKIGIWFQIY